VKKSQLKNQRTAKDVRVCVLAAKIVELMRQHPLRYEAFDALDVARVLFRPALSNPITIENVVPLRPRGKP
jgi:hypothetical protein